MSLASRVLSLEREFPADARCLCHDGHNCDVVDARKPDALPPPKVCGDCGRIVRRFVLVYAGSPHARGAA